MDEAILGDEVDDLVPIRDLHSDWEVVRSFGREVNVHSFLHKLRVGLLVIHLNDVQLRASGRSVGEGEELCI